MSHEALAAHYRKMYDRVSALAKIGVWECDLATGQLTWTDMVYDLFGIKRGAPIDRETTLALYEPKSRRELERLRSEAIDRGTGFTLDIQIRPESNESRWVRLTVEIEQEDGRSVRIFGTKQDITNERAAHEKLQMLQTEMIHLSRGSAMGAMASTMAHELSQPLTVASNYLSAARRIAPRESVSSDLDECIEEALEATHRAGEIIRAVRAMTRKGVSKKEEVELEQVLREATNLAVAGVPHLSVSWDIVPELTVYADRVQIQQVMINLIRNAYEAAGGGACQIGIKASAIGTDVEVCVSDEGPGIPPDLIPEIFEAFISTRSEGLGIGLSISRTIIEAHGGRIRAENLPEGGASVSFTLPSIGEMSVC